MFSITGIEDDSFTRLKETIRGSPQNERAVKNDLSNMFTNSMFVHDVSAYPDYDLRTANPPFQSGMDLEMIVSQDLSGMCRIIVRQLHRSFKEYERIGPVTTELLDRGSEGRGVPYDQKADSLHNFIKSQPVEEVKIV